MKLAISPLPLPLSDVIMGQALGRALTEYLNGQEHYNAKYDDFADQLFKHFIGWCKTTNFTLRFTLTMEKAVV